MMMNDDAKALKRLLTFKNNVKGIARRLWRVFIPPTMHECIRLKRIIMLLLMMNVDRAALPEKIQYRVANMIPLLPATP
jgi:hypothetical protein